MTLTTRRRLVTAMEDAKSTKNRPYENQGQPRKIRSFRQWSGWLSILQHKARSQYPVTNCTTNVSYFKYFRCPSTLFDIFLTSWSHFFNTNAQNCNQPRLCCCPAIRETYIEMRVEMEVWGGGSVLVSTKPAVSATRPGNLQSLGNHKRFT